MAMILLKSANIRELPGTERVSTSVRRLEGYINVTLQNRRARMNPPII